MLKKSKKYKQLIENGVKVVFKPILIDKNSHLLENSDGNNDKNHFLSVLNQLVQSKKDPILTEIYKTVFF